MQQFYRASLVVFEHIFAEKRSVLVDSRKQHVRQIVMHVSLMNLVSNDFAVLGLSQFRVHHTFHLFASFFLDFVGTFKIAILSLSLHFFLNSSFLSFRALINKKKFTYSHIHIFTHSYAHTFIRSHIHTLTHMSGVGKKRKRTNYEDLLSPETKKRRIEHKNKASELEIWWAKLEKLEDEKLRIQESYVESRKKDLIKSFKNGEITHLIIGTEDFSEKEFPRSEYLKVKPMSIDAKYETWLGEEHVHDYDLNSIHCWIVIFRRYNPVTGEEEWCNLDKYNMEEKYGHPSTMDASYLTMKWYREYCATFTFEKSLFKTFEYRKRFNGYLVKRRNF